MLVGMKLNWLGAHILVPGDAAEFVAWGAVAAELVKLSWLAGMAYAFRQGMWAATLAIMVMGILLHAFSLVCAVGISATGRNADIETKQTQQETRERASRSLQEAKARIEALGGQRETVEIEKDLDRQRKIKAAAIEDAAEEKRTGEGPNYRAAIRDQKAARKRIASLEAELESSRKLDNARQARDAARQKLDGLKVVRTTDPQAAALATVIPAPAAVITEWLPLLPSLIVEITPVIAIWLAVILWQAGPRKIQTTVQTTVTTSGEGGARSDALHQLKGWLLARDGQMVASQRQIASAMGVPAQTFADWVASWRNSGEITTERQGNKTVFRLRKAA
ncbi:MAG: hypothetical protein ACLFPA_12580 [Dichotomicrobium sp.]